MKILVYEPNKEPYEKEVEDDLKVLQEIVGGYIEAVNLGNDIMIICNEEGLIHGLPKNRCGFVGTIFMVGTDGEEFRGLTDQDIIYIKKKIEQIEKNQM